MDTAKTAFSVPSLLYHVIRKRTTVFVDFGNHFGKGTVKYNKTGDADKPAFSVSVKGRKTMNDTLIHLLRCPVCGGGVCLSADGKSLTCLGARRHCFDFAKSGYVNLAPNHTGGGDDRDMVRARTEFLAAGYYQPVADGVLSALTCSVPDGASVIDAGCGEGYYSCRFATSYSVFGADLSKAAVDHAARTARHQNLPDTLFAVAGIFGLPIADASVDAVVSLFAPIAEDEFLRVLKPGGVLILAGAGPNHLMGLKQVLYDTPYQNEKRADLPEHMTLVSEKEICQEITVKGNNHIRSLFSMTPYYWRTADADRRKLDGIETLETPIDVEILTYRKALS